MSAAEYTHDFTSLLNAARPGDAGSLDRLWSVIYSDVHAMARRACSVEGARTQLQPTLVVHELYLRFFGEQASPESWEHRRHFWGAIGRAMGQLLVDLARSEGRLKRGGGRAQMPLEIVAGELEDVTRALSADCVEVIEALNRLERRSPEAAAVARLRYISGLSIEQTAILLDIAPRTVSKRWTFARAWLRRALAGDA
ncbi:MAG: hypothetical protein RLZZ238_2691 [Planctomycetota bacterium]|jgi:RNA polymerase sigma factor (TIGR02999 family)